MVCARSLAAVAHQLEPPEHLAHGKEAQALGEDDAARNQLALAEIADLLK